MKNKHLLNRITKNGLAVLGLFLLFSADLFAQQTTVVSGKLTDELTNEPLVGVVVTTKDGSVGATTDENGSYSFETTLLPPFTIVIAHPGYGTKEIEYSGKETNLNVTLKSSSTTVAASDSTITNVEETGVTITARRRNEKTQDVPIPITVISGKAADDAGAFNVNRLKELVPSVQLYASNARNTTLNIRGLGSTFGLTNDGIDPGVGFYVDGVYYARPAATSLDFVDVDQIEILRGPQGTLFGKNTTAGAFNITSKKPSFKPGAKVELSYGNYNFIQAKASVTGGLTKTLAARLSLSGTQRTGYLYNPVNQKHYNGQNNLGLKGQLLFTPSSRLEILASGDYTRQRPDGYALVVAGITTTERSAYRQYDKIVSDLGYQRPVVDPFARNIYTNSPWRHDQELGGASLNIDYKIGKGKLTSTSAWRFWNWDPSNDRDFSEFSALTKSQGTSRHDQYSQEIRYAGNITEKVSGVVGVFGLYQNLQGLDQTEEVGKDQWRFVQESNTTVKNQDLYSTPGLLDGYGIKTNSSIKSTSLAAFAQADWEVLKGLHVLPGLRYTYDKKDVDYDRRTYGGLQTTDAKLITLQQAVYSNQSFKTNTNNSNLSGNFTVAYKPTSKINAFVTYSTGYKPVGVNVGGLPAISTTNLNPDLSLAVVKPEYVQQYEVGVKTNPIKNATLNITAFNTDIRNYQTNVQSPQIGVNRGYLANAEKVNVKGLELDGSYRVKKFLSVNASGAYYDGKYVKFTNAPLPLEETGHTEIIGGKSTTVAFKDASGGVLPGLSKWNVSAGAELSTKGSLAGLAGRYFIAGNLSYRSEYSSNATPSRVLKIDGYSLINARVGFSAENYTIFIWGRNLANTNYYEQLQAAAGNSGLYAGVLGDPRTYGVTLRFSY